MTQMKSLSHDSETAQNRCFKKNTAGDRVLAP